MTIQHRLASQPQIDSDKIITFPEGIPGFERYTTYRIYHKETDGQSAYWLEACEDPGVTFTLVDPTSCDLNYEFSLDDKEQELLKATDPNEIGVFLMLIKNEAEGKALLRGNVRGPVVINVARQLGLQKILVHPQVQLNIQEQ